MPYSSHFNFLKILDLTTTDITSRVASSAMSKSRLKMEQNEDYAECLFSPYRSDADFFNRYPHCIINPQTQTAIAEEEINTNEIHLNSLSELTQEWKEAVKTVIGGENYERLSIRCGKDFAECYVESRLRREMEGCFSPEQKPLYKKATGLYDSHYLEELLIQSHKNKIDLSVDSDTLNAPATEIITSNTHSSQFELITYNMEQLGLKNPMGLANLEYVIREYMNENVPSAAEHAINNIQGLQKNEVGDSRAYVSQFVLNVASEMTKDKNQAKDINTLTSKLQDALASEFGEKLYDDVSKAIGNDVASAHISSIMYSVASDSIKNEEHKNVLKDGLEQAKWSDSSIMDLANIHGNIEDYGLFVSNTGVMEINSDLRKAVRTPDELTAEREELRELFQSAELLDGNKIGIQHNNGEYQIVEIPANIANAVENGSLSIENAAVITLAQNDADGHAKTQSENNTPLNERISNPVIQNDRLLMTVDGKETSLRIPDKILSDYKTGDRPINEVANYALAYIDRAAELTRNSYDAALKNSEHQLALGR